MVTKIRSRLFKLIGILGIAFTIGTILLPLVRTPQTMVLTGPTAQYGQSETTLSGYFIPPVAADTRLTLVITGYSPSSLYLSVFPTVEGGLEPVGSPVFIVRNFSNPLVRLSFVSQTVQSYGIYVVSGNRTQFVIAVDGNWSGFYVLRGYTAEGLFIALGGFLGYSYFRTWEKRAALEEQARKEAAPGTPAAPTM
ncbi:MAG: hypothetical protein HY297_01245 [Thaumarchaeota archaeon]|nr:hypothetical protein [Nitrososphaerota archaeon]